MSFLYCVYPSSFGDFIIVWKEEKRKTIIQRIFLCDEKLKAEKKVAEVFQESLIGSSQIIDEQGKKIQQFLHGEDIKFDLKLLDFECCSEIQKKVLITEYNIPRGWIL